MNYTSSKTVPFLEKTHGTIIPLFPYSHFFHVRNLHNYRDIGYILLQ
jgi:hypothetical protein